MQTIEALTTLGFIASTQWSLVTTQQVIAAGVTRNQLTRLTSSGSIDCVRNGVYALSSASYGPFQDLRAAWLATEPMRGVTRQDFSVSVSGISAAAVYGIGDLFPMYHEFTSPRRRQSSIYDVRFRRRSLPRDQIVLIDGLPVTSLPRTVADIAETCLDYEHLADIVRGAYEKPEVTAAELSAALAPVARRHGAENGEALFLEMVRHSPATQKFREYLEITNRIDPKTPLAPLPRN
ncbi:type IV toxin-antitoxin system AbiEi family antitoxin domain-containing protein [Leucobacter sp. cx-328]|uniref:type IV toxin-antitoxin system AbiEi family antitoxin domain-containing protein n=1 Tax=unclassified Leucobacter TaxID=2621730 RepID=UPI00165D82BA|nr:type IV toxin-antitoxin system AbiEi family antitoxin domain-containing protein [Leucobacter sp. cx-328]